MALVLACGGGPNRDPIGFRYWRDPGAMKAYILEGNTGNFLGFLKSFVNAVFAFYGAEVIAVAACETKHPRHNIPKAVRRKFANSANEKLLTKTGRYLLENPHILCLWCTCYWRTGPIQ